MRATVMYGAGDVRVENLPDPTLQVLTDAVVRVRAVRILRQHLRVLPRGPAHLLPARRVLRHGDVGGAQAEAVRVPLADGTLVKAPVRKDSALLPSLLTLSDVFLTGHHAAVFDRAVDLAGVPDGYQG